MFLCLGYNIFLKYKKNYRLESAEAIENMLFFYDEQQQKMGEFVRDKY